MKLRSGRVLNEASIIMELKMLFLKSCVALLQSENKEISNFSIDSVTNDEALLYFAWHLSGPDATPVPSEDMVKFLEFTNHKPYEKVKSVWREELWSLIETAEKPVADPEVEPSERFDVVW